MHTNSTKVELRKKFLSIRNALSDRTVAEKSSKIVQEIIDTTEWASIRTIHCFLPLVGDNEPDMRALILFAKEQGIGVYKSSPPAETERLDSRDVPEYSLSDTIQFDVVIVPMIAYDPATNHRLGFGGGFYDRMLVNQTNAQKIGVCFAECATSLRAEPHDIPLDKIVAY